jgi:hypothetical protein
MKVINVEDIDIGDTLCDAYTTSKYIERQGYSLDNFSLGNVHDEIEEATDELMLPITQVINDSDIVEGYIIGA